MIKSLFSQMGRAGLGLAMAMVFACGSDSGTNGTGTTLEGRADRVCAKMADLDCAPSDCAGELAESIAEAEGCEAELAAMFDCALETPMTCGASGGPEIPECSDRIAALNACQPECSGGSSISTCSMACTGGKIADWGVECSDVDGNMQCTCTSGAQTGKAFTLPGSCVESTSWQMSAKTECQ